MEKILILFIAMILGFSCSKKGVEKTSKIKVVGSGTFTPGGALEVKANNGLLFWGSTADGKSFVQKVDTDTADIELPNGLWNLYAVSWEQTGPLSAFEGKTYCGKVLGVNLTGTTTNVNLNLLNESCSDIDFAAATTSVSGVNELPFKQFVTCKNTSSISTYASTCTREILSKTNNHGHATYVKVLVPQYKTLNGVAISTGAPIESGCMEIDSSTLDGETIVGATVEPGTIRADSLRFPDGKNGLNYKIRAYFSKAACLDSTGSIELPIEKTFNPTPVLETVSKVREYFSTSEQMVCSGNRLTTDNVFAGGRGTVGSPYLLCTTDQFNSIDSKLLDATYYTQTASFELVADLNFNFTPITIVGGDPGLAAQIFGGPGSGTPSLIEGNHHRIENFKITCTSQDVIGLFRDSRFLNFQNLTINNAQIDCPSRANVGIISGNATTEHLFNVKVTGHMLSGYQSGGFFGDANDVSIDLSHSMVNIEGTNDYIGGFAGRLYITNPTTINRTSYGGSIRSTGSYVGGISGMVICGVANCLNNTKTVVKSNIEVTNFAGGLYGNISSSGDMTLSDSYFEGTIVGNDPSPYLGGIVGAVQIPITTTRVIALAHKYTPNSMTSMGGIFAYTTSPSNMNCTDVYYFDDAMSMNSPGTCNDYTTSLKDFPTLVTATDTFATTAPLIWLSSNGGLPRLVEESTSMADAPYLNNTVCDNHFTVGTMLGSGTSGSPYFICSKDQLLAMTPGNYYSLKQNIYLNPTNIFTTLPAGLYNFEGNFHTISGMHFPSANTGNNGMFTDLGSGSVIKNFTLFGSDTQIPTTYSTNYSLGLLAGRNNGTISNVQVLSSQIYLAGSNTTSNIDTGSSNYIGGLVGLNDINATLSQIKTDIRLKHKATAANSHASNAYIGGVVGFNNGIMSDINYYGNLEFDPSNIANTEYYGGVVGGNAGTVKGVDSEAKFLSAASTSIGGSLNIGVLAGMNSGNFYDINLKSSADFTNITSFSNAILIPNNAGSPVMKRLIFDPIGIFGYTPASASEFYPATGVVDESFCIHPSISGCMNSTISQFSFVDPLFTAGTFVTNSILWNMTSSMAPTNTYTWNLINGDIPPNLIKANAPWKPDFKF